MAILILFVFLLPISIRLRCLDHLVANRVSWFQTFLCHISTAYLVFMQLVYFFKCHIKKTCLTGRQVWFIAVMDVAIISPFLCSSRELLLYHVAMLWH